MTTKIKTQSGSMYLLEDTGTATVVTRFSEARIYDQGRGAWSDECIVQDEVEWADVPEVGAPWLFRLSQGPVRTTPVVEVTHE